MKEEGSNLAIVRKKYLNLWVLPNLNILELRKAPDPNKHLKKLSEIFNCEPSEVFQGEIIREIEKDFINNPTNIFQRTFHERKPGYVNLKIDGWFTKKQIVENYKCY